MTQQEFEAVLKIMNVKKFDDEYRIKGFLLTYIKSPFSDYILLKGKIPYSLAQIIYNSQNPNHLKPELEFQIPHKDEQHPIIKQYITRIKITSSAELCFVIDTIREQPFINEWAIGNY